MSIIYTLIILSVLICVHEFGHFIIAKMSGVKVNEFAIGMGPKVAGVEKNGTEYNLRLLPIGGYVNMLDEDEEGSSPDSFNSKSVSKRMAISAAGPIMNFLIAIVLFAVAFMHFGAAAPNALIGEITPDSPAYVAGMEEGDVVIAINDKTVNNWAEATELIREVGTNEGIFTVDRDGQMLDLPLTPIIYPDEEFPRIGIIQGTVQLGLLPSIKEGFQYTYDFTLELVATLGAMITGEEKVELAGPVGIVGLVDEVASIDFMRLFLLAGMLSVNLGVLNLVPFPGLDGSRLLFLLIEGIRGKAIDREKEGMINFIGLIFLMGLMIFVTYNDIMRLFGD